MGPNAIDSHDECIPEMPFTDTKNIIAGLMRPSASISPKYFYDTRGSELFEAITRLPEYYLTRTERAIMAAHGADIAQRIGSGVTLIELGAGSCEKARALCRLIRPVRCVAMDISADFLLTAVDGLRKEFPALDVRSVVGDLTDALELPADLPREGRLVFYPGSSIGNFDPPHALDLLTRVRALAGAEGMLLIGIDLPKKQAVLEAAYDDAAGVTAAFNRNLLSHLNRLIGSDFNPGEWRHVAFFNPAATRIEMHLEAAADTLVRWPGGKRRFVAGERIHTENSYKYPLVEFFELLSRAGFPRSVAWTDERNWFAVILAQP